MSELARRRNARDLWISRGHLAAAASGAASLAVATFAIGFFFGQNRRPPEPALTAFSPDEGLIELLARIESTAALPGGVDEAMTFPDLLQTDTMPNLPDPAPVREGRVVVGAGGDPGVPLAKPPPGAFTVVVGKGDDAAEVRAEAEALRHRGLAAWVSVARVDGEWAYRIAVGGFDDEASARQALALAHAAGVPGAVEPILPPVAPTRPVPPAPPAPAPGPPVAADPAPEVEAPEVEVPEVEALEVEEPGVELGPEDRLPAPSAPDAGGDPVGPDGDQ